MKAKTPEKQEINMFGKITLILGFQFLFIIN